jgi:hypothetical protein
VLMNGVMRALLRHTDLAVASRVDSRLGGALLLGALRCSYSGRRSLFTDVTSYEAAVDGRGVPDMDLPYRGPRRVDMLIRRSYSFACEALSQLSRIPEPRW